MTKCIIDCEEKPGIPTLTYDRSGQARGEGIAIVDPGCLSWRTRFACESRAAYCARNCDPVVLRRELFDSKRNSRIVEADRHVDLFSVKPLSGNRCADIGLVLVICEHDIYRFAEH